MSYLQKPATLQSRLLNALRTAEGGFVTKAQLVELIYPDPDTQPDTAMDCITVAAFQLRKKGFPIKCQYGRGYKFVPSSEPLP